MENPRLHSNVEGLRDHASIGHALAERLGAYRGRADVVVLALGRGGALIAFAIARALDAPLDIFVVRMLRAPGTPELSIGAIASGGTMVLNDDLISYLALSDREVDIVRAAEERELERCERAYRGARPMIGVCKKTIIVVDDGLATEATMRLAIQALHELAPAHIVIAMPVAALDAFADVRRQVDKLVCLPAGGPHQAVGLLGDAFDPITDTEIEQLLDWAPREHKEH
jgi:putative phosphoribosyl transferase